MPPSRTQHIPNAQKLARSLAAVTEHQEEPKEVASPEEQGGSRIMEDQSVERMLERYHLGLLTKEELDDFLQLQRHRNELLEKALEAGRMPGRATEER